MVDGLTGLAVVVLDAANPFEVVPVMPQMTGGEAAVSALLRHGVDCVFGLPGIQNDWLYNALYDVGNRIRVIHTRREQGAAYMALGAALATGEMSVWCGAWTRPFEC